MHLENRLKLNAAFAVVFYKGLREQDQQNLRICLKAEELFQGLMAETYAANAWDKLSRIKYKHIISWTNGDIVRGYEVGGIKCLTKKIRDFQAKQKITWVIFMFEVGRVVVKIAGRDAGLKGVIVDVLDNNSL